MAATRRWTGVLAALLLLAGCGGAPSQLHFGQGATVVCGQTLIDSASDIPLFQVPDAASYRVPNGWLSSAAGTPIVLRFGDDCQAGATVDNRTPSLLRLGRAVQGSRSGVVAVLVYGVRAGEGTLEVSRPPGAVTEVTVPVS